VSRRRGAPSSQIGPALVVAGVAVLALGACSPGGVEPGEVTGVPQAWLDDTGAGWVDSDGYGQTMPYLSSDDCLLADEPPEILGEQPEFTDTGWGPFGDDAEATDSYRYTCGLWTEDRYAGGLQLIKVADAAAGAQLTGDFDSLASTDVQENEVTTVTSGQLELSVQTQWIPSNPQGSYTAMYYDEAALAAVVLEVNSLDETDFGAMDSQDAADALVAAMAASTE
jgi:hypothetical protein